MSHEDTCNVPCHFYGVYQIGEVYARSCVVIGTSGDGMSMPKRTAS